MATKSTKKARKAKHLYRNAVPPPRSSTNSRPSAVPRPSGGRIGDDTPAWRTIKTAGGAVGAALACAYIARENWIPPKVVTGLVSAVGGTLAVGGQSDTLRAVGAGVMSAAGAQLGLMLIDDHYHGSKSGTPAPATIAAVGKKPANTESLPPGALESAYERARARLAMATAAGHMAA
jgi:hypothetical protein